MLYLSYAFTHQVFTVDLLCVRNESWHKKGRYILKTLYHDIWGAGGLIVPLRKKGIFKAQLKFLLGILGIDKSYLTGQLYNEHVRGSHTVQDIAGEVGEMRKKY